jgi:ribonuclease P protein component
MVGKAERLSRAEFTQYFARSTRYHASVATILTMPAPSRKFAVVVSKKVAKSAVQRNVLRRQLYGLLSDKIHTPLVCIVILKPGAINYTRKELRAAMCELIGRALKNQ